MASVHIDGVAGHCFSDDGVPFEEKMTTLTEKLAEQFARGAELETTIRENLRGIGYEF